MQTLPPTLLIIDDSPEDRFAIRMFLSDSSLSDCIVHDADSGAKGLAAIQDLRPDCVLLDYRLADMTGFDVLDGIRDHNGDPTIAVVMFTGSGDEIVASAAMRAGAQDYLPKDQISEKSLPLTISNAISRFALVNGRREHENRLSLFIDRAPAAVAMFDREMRFLKVSRRYVKDLALRDLDPADLVGCNIYDIIPDIPETWRHVHQRVVAGETLSADEDYIHRADGRSDCWRWEMTPWMQSDGRPGGALLFAELITEQKEAEKAIRLSEERLRISQQAGHIGCWDRDFKSDALYWSSEQYALYGLNPGDPIHTNTWIQAAHPEDRVRIAEEFSDMVADPSASTNSLEFRIMLPPAQGGAIRWIHSHSEISRDHDGTAVRVIGVSIDVTERRETELALRRLTEDLEQRVAEEVAAREDAHGRLVQAQRMEALGQLASGIAHDFNNVLQAVSGGLALIERSANNPDVVRRFAAMATGAAARGATITGRLLAFSRSGELKSESVAAHDILGSQQELLFHTLGSSIVLTVEADAALPHFVADKAQLETVLINLAVNARDAMPNGGSLIMRAYSSSVLVSHLHPAELRPGGYVAIEVSDTGQGMDAATLTRASEPFFTTKPIGKGTGLGLAMARGFAEQSGGGFSIQSSPGKGATVTLWFPVFGESDIVSANRMILTGQQTSLRILLVDDDRLVMELIAMFLADEGHIITEASDGFTALSRFDAGEEFDLMITDFAMPGMNGLVLMEEAKLRRPDLPMLLLTGYVDARVQAAIDAKVHKATGVLRKPFSPSELLQSVANLMQQIPPVIADPQRKVKVQDYHGN